MGVFMQEGAVVNANIAALRSISVKKGLFRRYGSNPNGGLLDYFHLFIIHYNRNFRHFYSLIIY